MAEYIKCEQAREVICGWCEYTTCLADDYYWDKCDAKRRLGDIPAADVKPVVHGNWIKVDEQPYFRKHFHTKVCSVCRMKKDGNRNYCPNCGADMRGIDDG